jgi:hypothetical protein
MFFAAIVRCCRHVSELIALSRTQQQFVCCISVVDEIYMQSRARQFQLPVSQICEQFAKASISHLDSPARTPHHRARSTGTPFMAHSP